MQPPNQERTDSAVRGIGMGSDREGGGALEELVVRAQHGDTAAFEQLVIEHTHETFRLAVAMVGPDDAYDAAQEAFVQAWRHLRELREPALFTGWLRAITVNACRMQLRSDRRRPATVAWDGSAHDPTDPAADAAADVGGRDVVDRAFDELSPDVRAVLALHYVSDLPLSEVAATLGVPEGTVKSRLNAGLRALRGRIRAEGMP
jgi:RNA polymerase sigma-70 factor (ECF subfamily)